MRKIKKKIELNSVIWREIFFFAIQFERTTMHLAEKFNNQIEDAAAMSSLVDSITEQCFKEEQFLNLAGRFFSYLAQNVKVETDGVTLRSLLLQKWVPTFI